MKSASQCATTNHTKDITDQVSGAYIFKPKSPKSLLYGSKKEITGIFVGKLVQQFSLKSSDDEGFNSFAKVRLADSHLEFEILLDSIPGDDWLGQGKEVVASWRGVLKIRGERFLHRHQRLRNAEAHSSTSALVEFHPD